MRSLRGQLWVPMVGLSLGLCMAAAPPDSRPVDGSGEGSSTACAIDTVNFPSYPSIEPNIAFWTRVFGEWSQGQVVVHDLEYPAIIYEVVDLPGSIEESYTEEQLEFVEDLNEFWQARLKGLARKTTAREALDENEKRLAVKITTTAGSQAVDDADERVRTQRGLRERFLRGVEISYRYEPHIREIFRSAGLPEDLAYMPHVESSYQAAARSSAGAVGVWQFTRGTGRRFMKINSAFDERLDPILAAEGAAAYLEEAHRVLGDWALALTSYNHGVNGMIKAKGKHGSNYEQVFLHYEGRLFGFASRNFYAEFLAARDVACNLEHFFPKGLTPEPLHDPERIELGGRTTPARIAGAFGIPLEELAELNPAWTPRAVRSDLPLPEGSAVWLPIGTLDRLARVDVALEDAWSRPLEADGTHVVQRGDTLSTIAQSYGMSVRSLRDLNGMSARQSLIRVGQRLRVVGTPADGTHVVRRGETLSGIARRYGMSLRQLRLVNGLDATQSLIRPGQRLRVSAESTALSAVVHVVRSGETLIRIALSYGVALADLLVHNGLTEHSTIYPGQRLVVPRQP